MNCLGVPGLCHLVTSLFLFVFVTDQVKGDITLEQPNDLDENGDLVVESGSNFNLTCRGDQPLAWKYNNYIHEEGTVEQPSRKYIHHTFDNGQHISTLEVQNAYYNDTGYFYCLPEYAEIYSPLAKSIYIFVKDTDHYLTVNSPYEVAVITQGENATINCRPTDPNLSVTLEKDGEMVSAKYDSHVGFTFLVDTVHQGGEYQCCINSECLVTWSLIVQLQTHTDSIESPHVGNPKQSVLEGTNATLNCSVHHPDGTVIILNWTTPNPELQNTIMLDTVSKKVKVSGKMDQLTAMRQLIIYNVTKKNEGEYSCHVFDNSNNANNNTVQLFVRKEGIKVLNLSVSGLKYNTIEVAVGSLEAKVIVDIESSPVIDSIIWYDNNNNLITKENTHFIINNTESSSQLTIKKPDVDFYGNYTLVAKNKYMKKSITIMFKVLGKPKARIQLPLTASNDSKRGFYIKNNEYNFDCDVNASPKANISWFFKPCDMYPQCSYDLKKIKADSEIEMNMIAIKSKVKFLANQTGELFCLACSTVGCTNISTTILISDVKDGFSVEGPSLIVESDDVNVKCVASKYDFNKNITWNYCYNGICSSRNDVVVELEETDLSYVSKLSITNITKNHTGNYYCIVNYRHKRNISKEQYFDMDVEDLNAPVFLDNSESTKLAKKAGSKVILRCEVRGMPPPTVTWYKNVDEILKLEQSKYQLNEGTDVLELILGIDDGGTYTCVASNKVGKVSKSFTVTVTDKPQLVLYIAILVALLFAVLAVGFYLHKNRLRRKVKELSEAGLLNFVEGNIESLNPEINIGEQADLLPYDKKWEFPRDKLKMGKQLGAGAFGVVMKAEAYEIMEKGVATTVAVKMVKRNSDAATIKALVSELKIMIHLGKHLNVVNLLGACTGGYNRRELLVLVEYCQYGNLQTYLLKHRGAFINQVNPNTGTFDPTLIQPTSPTSPSSKFFYTGDSAGLRTSAAYSAATDTTLVMSDMSTQNMPPQTNDNGEETPVGQDGYLISRGSEWRNSDRGDYKEELGLKPVFTQDLICWGFQIARGMEYLASRKVLHGDLAARNVLLAEGNIVKICDFGLSKSVYRDGNYQKKGDAKLPVKWMALESIRDRVFSTQSDVWSYGVTLWELFSLSVTPYPGMEADERLFMKIENGYRMEKTKYATNEVYKVMLDCWLENPHSRPSFTELAERMGGMLEDTIRSHYVDLNDPFLQENSDYLAQRDYLSMLHSPNYANWSPNGPYLTMKPSKDPAEDVELTPMLRAGCSPPDSPNGLVTTQPIANNYVNVAEILSFSNPSYHNVGRPKQTPYMNMPHS